MTALSGMKRYYSTPSEGSSGRKGRIFFKPTCSVRSLAALAQRSDPEQLATSLLFVHRPHCFVVS
jgi:hypothetical protein